MTRIHEKLQVDDSYILKQMGVLLFTIMSGWATFNGLVALMPEAWLMAAMLTLGVQMLIIYSARRVGLANRVASKVYLFMVLLLLWTISSGMAYAYWWQQFRAADYAKERFGHNIERLIRPLQGFEAGYTALASEMAKLAEYSRNTARRERQHGGTCGDGSKKGAGPRQRLRNEDATIFSRHAQRFREQAVSFRQMMQELEQALKGFDPRLREEIQSRVRQLHRQALALAGDPELQVLRQDLAERLRLHAEGFRDGRGRVVRCPDPMLERGIRLVQQRLQALPKLPEDLLEVLGATHKDSVQQVYAEVFRLLGWSKEAPTFTARDVGVPLILAIIPDAIILWLSIGAARTHALVQGGMGSPLGTPPVKPRIERHVRQTLVDLEEAMQRDDERAAALLRTFLVRTGRHRAQLVVPEHPPANNTDAMQMMRLAMLLEAGGALQFMQAQVPVRSLRRSIRQRLSEQLRGVCTVTIYEAPPLLAVQFNVAAMPPAQQDLTDKNDNSGGRGRDSMDSGAASRLRRVAALAVALVVMGLGWMSWHAGPGEHGQAVGRPPALASGPHAGKASPASTSPLPLKRVVLHKQQNGHFLAPMRINGRPLKMLAMVDTGATSVSLPWEVAQELGLQPQRLTFDIVTQTANGLARVARVMLREVCIRDLCRRNVLATVSLHGRLNKPLLGMNFLHRLHGVRMRDGKMEMYG